MLTTNYSHAFLVGNFNGTISPHMLENDTSNCWKREIIKRNPSEKEKRYPKDYGYDGLCGMYYKAHLNAMIEVEDSNSRLEEEKELKNICHFVCNCTDNGTPITLSLNKPDDNDLREKNPFTYSFKLERLHFYFFPLGVVMFAIEIDDSRNDLDDLTSAHYTLAQLNLDVIGNKDLYKALNPLLKYCDKGRLYKDGNKLRIFQIIEIDKDLPEIQTKENRDALLYEIGSSSPIGCVMGTRRKDQTPSKSYYNLIISENLASSFNNWTGLALLDSFTVLGFDLYRDDWIYIYYPLIYLRCLFEKTFCFTRNYLYRNETNSHNSNLSEQIRFMEKYYFYDNISYSFQPNLLYSAMARGLQIREERAELARQIKENAKEENEKRKENEDKRQKNILAFVSVFAVFSVGWDLFQLLDYTICFEKQKLLSGGIAFFLCILLIIILVGLIYKWSVLLSSLGKLKGGISFVYRKAKDVFGLVKDKINKNSYHKEKVKIKINDDNRLHVLPHFDNDGVGSKFFVKTPEELLEEVERRYPDQLLNAQLEADNRYKLVLNFPRNIGTCNVVSLKQLNEKQRETIRVVERHGKKVRMATVEKDIFTSQCCLICSSDWHLITMFPGELAPPLPDSPDIPDDYWDNHVFIEPESK